jgi:anti-sigma regulatory factor (Ser/Thr protein kinase)
MQRDMDALPARFEATFSRPEENHAALLAAVEQFGLARALNQTLRYRLGVIVDELVMNAIMHGGCTGENQTLSVSIFDQPSELFIEIIDTGLPFDPTAHTLSRCPEEGAQIPIGGVGLCLVRRLADSMKYTRNQDNNNLRLSLKKTPTEDLCSLKK